MGVLFQAHGDGADVQHASGISRLPLYAFSDSGR